MMNGRPESFRHVMELETEGRAPAGAPQPTFVYVSQMTGAVIRGVASTISQEVVTRSVLHPGLFISIVLRGAATAGPMKASSMKAGLAQCGTSIGYADGEVIAFALAETTDWIGILNKGSAMRGIGLAVPSSALALLGLSGSFQSLFDQGGPVVSARTAANGRLQAICDSLLHMRAPDTCDRVLLDAYAMEAIVTGIRLLRDGERRKLRPLLKDRLAQARDLIDRAPTGAWTVDDLARKVGLGARSLRTYFREEFQQSVTEYARNVRLDRAREALALRQVTVSEAAYEAGYTNPANFATAFRRRFGHAPSAAKSHPEPAGSVARLQQR